MNRSSIRQDGLLICVVRPARPLLARDHWPESCRWPDVVRFFVVLSVPLRCSLEHPILLPPGQTRQLPALGTMAQALGTARVFILSPSRVYFTFFVPHSSSHLFTPHTPARPHTHTACRRTRNRCSQPHRRTSDPFSISNYKSDFEFLLGRASDCGGEHRVTPSQRCEIRDLVVVDAIGWEGCGTATVKAWGSHRTYTGGGVRCRRGGEVHIRGSCTDYGSSI